LFHRYRSSGAAYFVVFAINNDIVGFGRDFLCAIDLLEEFVSLVGVLDQILDPLADCCPRV
jgi:hypothetical protein